MDWKSVKFDWNRARAFLVTVEEGSLSAAARALGMTQPTLGRQVSALEEELGVVLFEHVGNGLILTPNGLELVDHVRAMGDAASRVSLSAAGKSQSIEGSICISASEVDATFRLPAFIAKLRNQEPGIDIEIVVSNDASDLRRREADIAIRTFHPEHPDLIAKKIREINIRLYASPGYINSIGNPDSVSGLSQADFIGFDRSDTVLNILNGFGSNLTQRNFPIITKFLLMQYELVKKGMGIALFPEDIGDADPQIERVIPVLEPIAILPLWLVSHRELRTSKRIRVVYDLLQEELTKF